MKSLCYFAMFICFLGHSSCYQKDKTLENVTKKTLIASAYNNQLYFEDIQEMIPVSANKPDSLAYINSIRERWIREKLLLVEAERNFPTDIDLEKLVQDYKSSLLKHHYEKQIIEKNLDTLITKEELLAFYNDNKQDYKLNEPIYNLKYVKVSSLAPDKNNIKSWLNAGESKSFKLVAYCNTYAEAYRLAPNNWMTVDELINYIPDLSEKMELLDNSFFELENETFHYFCKIEERVAINQIPPLSYVEEKAKSVILQKRKIALLNKKQDELYERAIKNRYVQIMENN